MMSRLVSNISDDVPCVFVAILQVLKPRVARAGQRKSAIFGEQVLAASAHAVCTRIVCGVEQKSKIFGVCKSGFVAAMNALMIGEYIANVNFVGKYPLLTSKRK